MARKSEQQKQIEALELRLLQSRVKLTEAAANYYDAVVDPQDAFRDDDTGELWTALGTNGSEDGAGIASAQQLAGIRAESRTLCATNPFAVNAIENRISYIVGSGHAYAVQAKRGVALEPEQIAAVQTLLDDFLARTRWHARQQEIRRRIDRDGECFLRVFVREGLLNLRFVEPAQVAQPANNQADSWGIRSEPDDVETPLAYWIDGQEVPAAEVQHRKENVDANVKRGLPLLFPVRKNLIRASKLLRNMTMVAEIQTAIAMLRKHKGGNAAGIQSWAEGKADATVTNSITGRTNYYRHYPPGSIVDAFDIDYEFPAQGIDGTRYVTILQAELRAIASRLAMPEFMLSSDASNANYASTMVAEGPAVKMFERLQGATVEYDLAILDMVFDAAVAAGLLEKDIRAAVEIQVTPPNVASRDRTKEVAADVQLAAAGAMSTHTLQLRHGLDPETEDEYLAGERERKDPFGGMGTGDFQTGDDDGKAQPDDADADGAGDGSDGGDNAD